MSKIVEVEQRRDRLIERMFQEIIFEPLALEAEIQHMVFPNERLQHRSTYITWEDLMAQGLPYQEIGEQCRIPRYLSSLDAAASLYPEGYEPLIIPRRPHVVAAQALRIRWLAT